MRSRDPSPCRDDREDRSRSRSRSCSEPRSIRHSRSRSRSPRDRRDRSEERDFLRNNCDRSREDRDRDIRGRDREYRSRDFEREYRGRDRDYYHDRDRDRDHRYPRDRYQDFHDRDRRGSFDRRDRNFRRNNNDGRENPRPSNCLGIFGMSLSTTERDLREIFERYGSINSVKVIFDHYTGKSRGFGFISFDHRSDAAKARDRVADSVIDGMRVRVDYAVQRHRSPARERSPMRD